MKLSPEETKQVIKFYYGNGSSPTKAARAFNLWAGNNNVATRVTEKNVRDAIKRFDNHTKLQHSVKKRTPASKDENVLLNVVSSLYVNQSSSIRTCSTEIGISVGTTHNIARHVLNLRPYRLALVQKLTEYDKLVRVLACQQLLPIICNNPIVFYSDEACFRTDGHVNRHNCYLWDYSRPEDFVVEADQGASRTMCWAAMSHEKLFGPYFFPASVSADTYQAILSEFFVPELLHDMGNVDNVWFQQDGAPAHTADNTKVFLANIFDTRIISRGFQNEWPPRSPDITPCDFFLWSAVSELVYLNGGFNTCSELQDAIIGAFNTLRHNHMDRVRAAVLSVSRRMQNCIQGNGSQLVHS